MNGLTLVTDPADETSIGTPLVVSGAGWGNAHDVTVVVSGPEETMDLKIHLTSSAGGDISTDDVVDMALGAEGTWTFTATDDSDSSISASAEVRVFSE